MIHFTTGNLLHADVEAVVNTVNTMGVMGKGIALMFKERYPENYKSYAAACKAKQVELGRMFVTQSNELNGPRWLINFPTKSNWRFPSQLAWIQSGLADLKRVIVEKKIRSVAIPALGAGNGKLDWQDVRPLIVETFEDLTDVDVYIYEPTSEYQNETKSAGLEKLTPARAIIAEMIRRYEVLSFDCTILEVQKLSWVLTRIIKKLGQTDLLKLNYEAALYGPYADKLRHLLDQLDGSYLHCERRLADARPTDLLRFNWDRQQQLQAYLQTPEAAAYREVIEKADKLIDGFQSPLGMEVLTTVDWLLLNEKAEPTIDGIKLALQRWPVPEAVSRKQKLFTDKLIQAALTTLRAQIGAVEEPTKL